MVLKGNRENFVALHHTVCLGPQRQHQKKIAFRTSREQMIHLDCSRHNLKSKSYILDVQVVSMKPSKLKAFQLEIKKIVPWREVMSLKLKLLENMYLI